MGYLHNLYAYQKTILMYTNVCVWAQYLKIMYLARFHPVNNRFHFPPSERRLT